MFTCTRIRTQMYVGAALLIVIVALLSASGIHGAIKFRDLTKSVRARAAELPLTAELNRSVAELRVALSTVFRPRDFSSSDRTGDLDRRWAVTVFLERLSAVRFALNDYNNQLALHRLPDHRITNVSSEIQAVKMIGIGLKNIEQLAKQAEWARDDHVTRLGLEEELGQLQRRVGELPGLLSQRMETFADQVRAEYYSWVALSVVLFAGSLMLLGWLMMMFRASLFQPLQLLIRGSRRVAGGDYRHRIETHARGEVAQLVDAFNVMTANFHEIKTDLDHQVQLRTKEIVRKEQLASVGFLAAGVAHEINNPLAAIAWSAESLESRLHDMLHPAADRPSAETAEAVDELKDYLRRIQDEAFRCKEITSGLLDFSRSSDSRKSPTEIGPLLETVVDMVRPLAKYRDRNIALESPPSVVADVNPQELKQVVLNLLTNALDSLAPGGTVRIRLGSDAAHWHLVFEDDGCGMTDEVQRHLFEPFFTRRRDGQGTGLGLSITHRIVTEHGGTIRPSSAGPGRGSCFIVEIPLRSHEPAIGQVA